MTTLVKLITALVLLLLVGACNSNQSLQEYYVANNESENFISFDLPASLLNIEKTDLSDAQKEAVGSLRKLNILAFKVTEDNKSEFEIESAKVKAILKGSKYTELIKLNTPYGKATVKYLGTDDAIEEVVIYGDKKDKGFALIRVLGDDMNPAHLIQLIQGLQKSNFNTESLEQLKNIMN